MPDANSRWATPCGTPDSRIVIFSSDDHAVLAAWVRLTNIPGLGLAGQRKLLQAFASPEAVFGQTAQQLADVVGAQLASLLVGADLSALLAATLAWAAEEGNFLVPLGSPAYPVRLLDLADPPNLLYCKGNPDTFGHPALAIVGSRNPTPGGEKTAERFAGSFSEHGFVVVSGLALGIDAAAHRGALGTTRKTSTIAVIGTGIDRVYPARNLALARQIADNGLIVSEFPLGASPLAHHFPRRNRLIAALGQGVLVVEAALESGSLITARLGGELGRDVFAIPGSIHSPQSKGCHRLIKDGAKLVESATDVFEELGSTPLAEITAAPVAETPKATEPATRILESLGGDPLTVDLIGQRSGLTPDCLLAMLLELELAGRVAALPGGRYQRLD